MISSGKRLEAKNCYVVYIDADQGKQTSGEWKKPNNGPFLLPRSFWIIQFYALSVPFI